MNKIDLNFGFTYCPDTGVIYKKEKQVGYRIKPKLYVKVAYKNTENKIKKISVHNLIWESLHGEIPENFVVDHINGLPFDNRVSNLRCIPVSENYKNRSTPANNTSGHIGISFHKASQKWRARIADKLKEKHLGLFDTKEEAIKVWLEEKKNLNYHDNHGRDSIYV